MPEGDQTAKKPCLRTSEPLPSCRRRHRVENPVGEFGKPLKTKGFSRELHLQQQHATLPGPWPCRHLHEMVHDARIIPLDSRFGPSAMQAIGTGLTATLTERFTRVDEDTLLYEYTVDDPAIFTRPFHRGGPDAPERRADVHLHREARAPVCAALTRRPRGAVRPAVIRAGGAR